jgi:hypothetical protein
MERSAVDPPVWGYTVIGLLFAFMGLDGIGGSIDDMIMGWPLLGVGIYCVASAWRDWLHFRNARRKGIQLEARIVSRGRPPHTLPLLPQALGVVYRRLRLEYEVDGRTVVSDKLVPEPFVQKLDGQETLKIRVLPARPLTWVPIG